MIALIVGLLVVSASAGEQKSSKIEGYDDRPFTCGAVFRILMEGHVNDKDKKIYNEYKSIFDELYAKAKFNFANSGRTENDSRLEMQESINFIGKVASRDKSDLGIIVSYCNKFRRN